MLRFAPSPTGDMHIGHLRVAIFNYITAKQRNEDFIVRIEDIDKETNIEGKDQEILDILALFKIEYSQLIYQSQNVRFHSAMALQLMHEKKAFSCFCSDDWLEKKRKEALIKEFKTMHLSGHSAMDINIYAAEAGIEPNEVRRLMIHDEDANVDFMDEIQSFEDDETDSIIDYF